MYMYLCIQTYSLKSRDSLLCILCFKENAFFSLKIATVALKFSASLLSLPSGFKLEILDLKLYRKRKQIMWHFTFPTWIILYVLCTEVFIFKPNLFEDLITFNLKKTMSSETQSSVYLSTQLSSSRREVIKVGGRWSAFSLWRANSKCTGLRYKWNSPKPASIAKALYKLERKNNNN